MAEPANVARTRHVFGNYELLEEIGRGGMGVVYRAYDPSLDRFVALKVLRDKLRMQPQVMTRFQREAQAVASLHHPNVVQILCVGSVDRIPYLAMDYIPGEPLSRLMQREGPLPWARALAIAEQAAAALACAHDAQIIHRDVKPGNILVDANDQAYVTDFGIAKVLTADKQLTVDGTVLGTPQYMAPERCKNSEATAASDVYSLGVVMFQMVSGRLPFDAVGSAALVNKIASEPSPRLRSWVPDVPEDVERLVAYAMEKNPKDRPPTAEAFRAAIARVRAGKPLDEHHTPMLSALGSFHNSEMPKPVPARTRVSERVAATPLGTPSTPLDCRRGILAALLDQLLRTTPLTKRARVRLPHGVRWGVWGLLCAGMVFYGLKAVHVREGLNLLAQITGARKQAAGAWRSAGPVARFHSESPGVLRTTINLPDFAVSASGWAGGGTLALVQLDGLEFSLREGQRAVCCLEPTQQRASVCVSPLPPLLSLSSEPSIAALAFPASVPTGSPLAGRFLLRYGPSMAAAAGWRLMACSWDIPGTAPIDLTGEGAPHPQRIAAADVHPSGTKAALAVLDPDGTCFAREYEVTEQGIQGPGRRVIAHGGPITSLYYAPDGQSIACLREKAPDRRQLWKVRLDNTMPQSVLVAEGDLVFDRGGFAPSGGRLCVGEKHGEAGRLQLLGAGESDPAVEDIGDGWMAVWHPTGKFLVATAQDRKGNYQLWAICAEPPHRRLQLTYLSRGASRTCAISADGAWALAPADAGPLPGIVFVDLSGVTF